MTSTTTENETLTYAECLAAIESFMIESGIRQFCSEVCRGQCCGGCWEKSPTACHHNEGRRISCSVFICPALKTYLGLYWREFVDAVNGIVAKAMEKARLDYRFYGVYFTVHTPEVQANCIFPMRCLTVLPGTEIRSDIRRRLLFLSQQPDRPKDYGVISYPCEKMRQRYNNIHCSPPEVPHA